MGKFWRNEMTKNTSLLQGRRETTWYQLLAHVPSFSDKLRDSYIVMLLVSSLVPLMYDCQVKAPSELCCVVHISSAYYSTWTSYINFTILRKYSRSGYTCADTRPFLSSNMNCIQDYKSTNCVVLLWMSWDWCPFWVKLNLMFLVPICNKVLKTNGIESIPLQTQFGLLWLELEGWTKVLFSLNPCRFVTLTHYWAFNSNCSQPVKTCTISNTLNLSANVKWKQSIPRACN